MANHCYYLLQLGQPYMLRMWIFWLAHQEMPIWGMWPNTE